MALRGFPEFNQKKGYKYCSGVPEDNHYLSCLGEQEVVVRE
jgi:hypothetical protein